MRPYEAMVIFDPTLSEDETKAAVAKVSDMVGSIAKGKAQGIDQWGKRKLTYEIKHRSEGYYVVYTFTADPERIHDLEHALKISDLVLRFLVIRMDEKEA